MAETLAAEYHPREQELRDLLDGMKNQFFWCNTDREYSARTKGGYDLEQTMHERNYAAAWEKFKEPGHMKRLKSGDAVFMFAKGGVGIVGIGRAKAGVQVLQPGPLVGSGPPKTLDQ